METSRSAGALVGNHFYMAKWTLIYGALQHSAGSEENSMNLFGQNIQV